MHVYIINRRVVHRWQYLCNTYCLHIISLLVIKILIRVVVKIIVSSTFTWARRIFQSSTLPIYSLFTGRPLFLLTNHGDVNLNFYIRGYNNSLHFPVVPILDRDQSYTTPTLLTYSGIRGTCYVGLLCSLLPGVFLCSYCRGRTMKPH
jgi:hypothetical protein